MSSLFDDEDDAGDGGEACVIIAALVSVLRLVLGVVTRSGYGVNGPLQQQMPHTSFRPRLSLAPPHSHDQALAVIM